MIEFDSIKGICSFGQLKQFSRRIRASDKD
ncbi:hypothetical protein SANTM175S_02342 [Streptomyces antimycoticus]